MAMELVCQMEHLPVAVLREIGALCDLIDAWVSETLERRCDKRCMDNFDYLEATNKIVFEAEQRMINAEAVARLGRRIGVQHPYEEFANELYQKAFEVTDYLAYRIAGRMSAEYAVEKLSIDSTLIKSGDPTTASNRCAVADVSILTSAHRLAWESFKRAESALGKCDDKQAYDWIVEYDDADMDYKLPRFDTWRRYLTKARGVLGESKYQNRRNLFPTRSMSSLEMR